MSTAKRLSPTAQLLRQSRLFCMPPPLEAPAIKSKTGIPHHPLRQAIASPQSTRDRGDWGLKRDIPLKRTQYLDSLYYEHLDSIENFTRFNSAESDTTFVKRWQEIDKNLTTYVTFKATDKIMRCTAFDEGTSLVGTGTKTPRWRYSGPAVTGMSHTELQKYIWEKVIPRRGEFAEFVKAKMRADFTEKQNSQVGAIWGEGQGAEGEFTAEQLAELRTETILLEKYTREFLDIPENQTFKTHPSGGLYYTRSSANMTNDPVEGPISTAKELPGRRLANVNISKSNIVGIGGIAARFTDRAPKDMAPLGEEVQVYIDTAFLSPDGKLIVDATQDKEEIMVSSSTEGGVAMTDKMARWGALSRKLSRNTDASKESARGVMTFLRMRKAQAQSSTNVWRS